MGFFGLFKSNRLRSKVGASWFVFANFVFIGNQYPNTTVFAITWIDLHPPSNMTYSSLGNEIYTAPNYTAYNPSTDKYEEPRYLYIGFTGICHVFESEQPHGFNSSKHCTKKFVQPFFIPDGTLKNPSGETRSLDSLDVDFALANRMWQAAAALTLLVMIYNAANIIVTLVGFYDFAYRWHWPFAIVGTIPVVILVMVALTWVFQPIEPTQVPRWGASFDTTGAGRCIGMWLLFLGMLMTFVAHPVMLLGFLCFVFCVILFTIAILLSCCRSSGGSGRKEKKGECYADCMYYHQSSCPIHRP